jgi:LysR family transcriptional regulator, low CO2-responsive transcriptional regulator
VITLHQFAVFREVVREGSITRAAARLFISQPSVSIQIKRLEQLVGTRLVERLNGRIIPTTAGERLFSYANQMIELETEARLTINELRAGDSGLLRVGSVTGALYYLGAVLKEIKEARPRLEIKLIVALSDEISHSAVENRIDLGLVWLPCITAGMVTRRLLRAPFVMVVSPRHPLARHKTVTPKMLNGQAFIGAIKGTGSHSLFIDEVLKRHSIRASVTMEFNHAEPIKRAAEANLGIGLLPRKAAEREIAECRLVSLNVKGLDLGRDLGLICRQPKLEEPLVALVAGQLRQFDVRLQDPNVSRQQSSIGRHRNQV